MEIQMNNEVKNVKKRTDISFTLLLDVLRKFIAVIAIVTVIVGALAGAYVKFFTRTKYSASAEFNVINVLPDKEYIDATMLTAAEAIATNCVDIIRKDSVIATAVDDHRLDKSLNLDRSAAIKKVASVVSAGKPSSESAIFTVTVTTYDIQETYEIISAVQSVLPGVVEEMYTLTDNSKISTTIKPLAITESIDDVREVRSSAVEYALIGMAATFVVSYVVAFLIYINDTKIYDDSTIKARFSSPVIGVIPDWESRTDSKKSSRKKKQIHVGRNRDYTGKLLCKHTPFAVSEAFNTLRTNLCYSTAAERCPVFAITSDFSGAGKSVISSNVALSLSMLGKRTLLLECDLRRPELAKIFSAEAKIGLSEFLSGNAASAEDVTYKHDNNLDIIFSGRIPPHPSELLGSEMMRELIASSKEKYEYIIIDTPPAFEVSDVGVISPLLTGTVMVARSNYSDVDAIAASEELINGVNGRIVGYVVNGLDLKLGSAYYYRKSKYGYRKYYRYSKYSKYSKYSRYARYYTPYRTETQTAEAEKVNADNNNG